MTGGTMWVALTRVCLGFMGAVLLTAGIVAEAPARSLSTSEQGFRVTWASQEFATSFVTVRCRVTFEGSFHSRTIAKTARALVGAVSRAIVAHPCTNGEAWVDNGVETEPLGTAPNRLPFLVSYESFTGTLPNISSVDPLSTGISVVIRSTVLGLTCQGRYGRPEDNITERASREVGGGITTLDRTGGANRASLVEQLGPNAVCPATGALAGVGNVTRLGGSSRITITLI